MEPEPDDTPLLVNPVALVPLKAGCAVFIRVENDSKTGLIQIDPQVGFALNLALSGQEMPRPMTHDLTVNILKAFQATMKGACIVSHGDEEGIYKARLVFEVCNDVMERQIIEVDSRPGDALALAVRMNAPFYIKESIWAGMEDVSTLLNDLKEAKSGEFPSELL